MTRTQATGILTGILIAVESAGYTKHHIVTFGHTYCSMSIFQEEGSESLDKVEDLLRPLIPDGMITSREYTSDGEVEYLLYILRYN